MRRTDIRQILIGGSVQYNNRKAYSVGFTQNIIRNNTYK